MTVTNHLLAGSVIALAIHEPLLVLPLAYVSHFLMDAIPHYGYPGGHSFSEAVKIASKHRLAHVVSVVTFTLSIVVAIILVVNSLWLALIAALMAASPDGLMFLNYLLYERKGLPPKGPKVYLFLNLKLHGRIQYERPWGIWVETVVFLLLITLVLRQV